MRVLIIKTSSLGDLIHTLPAVTDAMAARRDLTFDWVAEEAFVDVPVWHPAVDRVIPIAFRRWRKNWSKAWRRGELRSFIQQLRSRQYDLVLDAQGLFFKSALPALFARGRRCGYDRHSARDSWVSWTYQKTCAIARRQHAIERVRQLMALALDYNLPETEIDYGLKIPGRPTATRQPYLLFLHGTTWPSKHWPEAYWAELLDQARRDGYRVCLPWGSPEDRLRAERIIEQAGAGELLPKMGLAELAPVLALAQAVVGVDSGLVHLAAAFQVPSVTLYGPTSSTLTGTRGRYQTNLQAVFSCAPCLRRVCDYPGDSEQKPACFTAVDASQVWRVLSRQIQLKEAAE